MVQGFKEIWTQAKRDFGSSFSSRSLGLKNTNLKDLELYVLDPSVRAKLENALQLEPQERGYEVLLIEPYYESLLNLDSGFGQKHQSFSHFFDFS